MGLEDWSRGAATSGGATRLRCGPAATAVVIDAWLCWFVRGLSGLVVCPTIGVGDGDVVVPRSGAKCGAGASERVTGRGDRGRPGRPTRITRITTAPLPCPA